MNDAYAGLGLDSWRINTNLGQTVMGLGRS